jgi:hypothetical protein
LRKKFESFSKEWGECNHESGNFCRGFGASFPEETSARQNSMAEIGGRSILWRIMKLYSAHGINDFIVCWGYKAKRAREYGWRMIHAASTTAGRRKVADPRSVESDAGLNNVNVVIERHSE